MGSAISSLIRCSDMLRGLFNVWQRPDVHHQSFLPQWQRPPPTPSSNGGTKKNQGPDLESIFVDRGPYSHALDLQNALGSQPSTEMPSTQSTVQQPVAACGSKISQVKSKSESASQVDKQQSSTRIGTNPAEEVHRASINPSVVPNPRPPTLTSPETEDVLPRPADAVTTPQLAALSANSAIDGHSKETYLDSDLTSRSRILQSPPSGPVLPVEISPPYPSRELAALSIRNLDQILLSRNKMVRYFVPAEKLLHKARAAINADLSASDAGVLVSNLPPLVTNSTLWQVFQKFGALAEIRLASNEEGGNPQSPSARVLFETLESAKAAVNGMDNTILTSRAHLGNSLPMRVSHVRPTNSVFVSHLLKTVTPQALEEVFNSFGGKEREIQHVHLFEPRGGTKTRTAIIRYKLTIDAIDAVKEMHCSMKEPKLSGTRRLLVSFTFKADNRCNDPQLSSSPGGPLRFVFGNDATKYIELVSCLENTLVRVYQIVDSKAKHTLHFVTGTSLDSDGKLLLHLEGLPKPFPATDISNAKNIDVLSLEVKELQDRLQQHPERMLFVDEMASAVWNVQQLVNNALWWMAKSRVNKLKSLLAVLSHSGSELLARYTPDLIKGSGQHFIRDGAPFAAPEPTPQNLAPATVTRASVSASLSPLITPQQDRGANSTSLFQTPEIDFRKSDSPRHVFRHYPTREELLPIPDVDREYINAVRLHSIAAAAAAAEATDAELETPMQPQHDSETPDPTSQISKTATTGGDAALDSPEDSRRRKIEADVRKSILDKFRAEALLAEQEAAANAPPPPPLQRSQFASDKDFTVIKNLLE